MIWFTVGSVLCVLLVCAMHAIAVMHHVCGMFTCILKISQEFRRACHGPCVWGGLRGCVQECSELHAAAPAARCERARVQECSELHAATPAARCERARVQECSELHAATPAARCERARVHYSQGAAPWASPSQSIASPT